MCSVMAAYTFMTPDLHLSWSIHIRCSPTFAHPHSQAPPQYAHATCPVEWNCSQVITEPGAKTGACWITSCTCIPSRPQLVVQGRFKYLVGHVLNCSETIWRKALKSESRVNPLDQHGVDTILCWNMQMPSDRRRRPNGKDIIEVSSRPVASNAQTYPR